MKANSPPPWDKQSRKLGYSLEQPLENHALDHHRGAKGKLENVAENRRQRIVSVEPPFEWMDKQKHVEFLGGLKERLEDRIVERLVAHRVTDLQPFKSHALGFPGNCNGLRHALQRYAAEANESIGMFLDDLLNRLILPACEMRGYSRLFPIK